MNDITSRATRIWGLGAAALLAAALVAACGGGGGDAGSATASAYTAGPISGFGSIIVNGVRFDDSNAQVEGDDGPGSSANLKLGTMVEIDSDKVDDSTGRAKALRIRFGSEIVGPVAAVQEAANTFEILGQTVDVKPETVFDDSLSGGLAALKDQVVEVHALFDASTGHYIATRVELEDDAAFYKLRGLVSALDPVNKTFQIGAAVISYRDIGAADLPARFGEGSRVRVRLQKEQVAGQWVAVTIRSGVRKVEDHGDARLIGTVTELRSATDFDVNGLKVDAANATVENGPVVAGARVELRGTVSDGTVIATRVKVLKPNDDKVRGVELHGTVGELNTDTKTFVLRGVTVSYDATTVFKDGAQAQLVDGAKVEVKGVLSTDRRTLAAQVIEFES